jgi:hypothetical protein
MVLSRDRRHAAGPPQRSDLEAEFDARGDVGFDHHPPAHDAHALLLYRRQDGPHSRDGAILAARGNLQKVMSKDDPVAAALAVFRLQRGS